MFSEELRLDIGAAITAIGQVESRLSQVSSAFAVNLASSIDQLRDLRLEIGVDEASITSSINAAIDAVSTSVSVTGDASQLTGEVNSAIDAADTDVEITADASQVVSEIDEVGRRVDDLGDRLSDTATTGGQLRDFIGGAALLAGVRETVLAASDLNEAINVTGLVFEEASSEILRFSENADQALGLSQRAALEATSALGGMLQNLGFTRAEAVEMSQALTVLAADLGSAFNRHTADAVSAIQAALRGENEQIESLNVFINEAAVQQEAFRLGLASTAGELDRNAKAQATLSLIVQQTAAFQGDFANTANSAANALKRSAAEAENSQARLGNDLLPTVSTLSETFGTLSEAVGSLPGPIQQSLVALGVFAGTIKTLGTTAGPTVLALTAIAGAIASIGETSAAMAARISEAQDALLDLDPSQVTDLVDEAGRLQENLEFLLRGAAEVDATRVVGFLTEMRDAAAAAGIPTAELDALIQEFALHQIDLENTTTLGAAAIDGFRDSAAAASPAVTSAADSLQYLSVAARDAAADAIAAENAIAGIVGASLLAADALASFSSNATSALPDAGEVFDDLGRSIGSMGSTAQTAAKDATDAIADIAERTGDTIERLTEQAGDRMERLTEQAQEAQEALEEALTPASERDLEGAQLGVDRATQRQAEAQRALDEAIANQFSTEGGNSLADRQAAIADAELDLREATIRLADAQDDLTAVQQQGTEADEDVIAARERLAEVTAEVAEVEADLAEAIAEARADGAEAAREAAEAAEEANARIASSARGAATEVEVSAARLAEALRIEAGDLADFRSDLQTLIDADFAGVAAFIAERGPELGGALADELADALAGGSTELSEQVQAALDLYETEFVKTTDFFRNTLGPQFIQTSLFVGTAAATGFGESLDFEDRVRLIMGLAETALTEEGRSVAAVAAAEGASAAQAWGEGLGLDQETIDEAILAGQALVDNAPVEDALIAGASVGDAFGLGIVQGIVNTVIAIQLAAAAAVDEAERAAREAAESNSPSLLFARLGEDLGEGLILGWESTAGKVAASAESMVARASGSFEARSSRVSPVTATLDDSRILRVLERMAANSQPAIGSLQFLNSPDPGRDIDLVRRRLKAGQR